MFKKPSKSKVIERSTPLKAAKAQRGAFLREARPLFFERLHADLSARLFVVNAQLRNPAQQVLLAGDWEQENLVIRQNDEQWFSTGVSYEIGVGTFSGELLESHRRPNGVNGSQDKLFLWTSWQGLLIVTTHRDDYDIPSYATYLLNTFIEDAKLPCKLLHV